MRVPVVIVGAGHAGLAMSRLLSAEGVGHVVLERGDVANSWRTERWASLRLLTPNWLTRLPGWCYQGDDPDGYMTAAAFVEFLAAYRASFEAPVCPGVDVRRVTARQDGRFRVDTDGDTWIADVVVAASGASSEARLPAIAADLPAHLEQVRAPQYRHPAALADGEVLVVGASASGAQIADELARSGRTVTLAVGEHLRLPRTYRGRDIHWWMDRLGVLDERYDEVDDLDRARRLPSLQLIGTPQRRTLDLNALLEVGVRPVGKLLRVQGRRASCSGGLANLVAHADLKQDRLLDRIDGWIEDRIGATDGPAVGAEADLEDAGPYRPVRTRIGLPPTELSLDPFGAVVWATGFRPSLSWLDPAWFDRRGRPVHDGGIAEVPGLFYLGLPFMRRRKSNFIDGAGPDAVDLLGPLLAHLGRRRSA